MPYTYNDFQNPTEADFNDPAFMQAENDYANKSSNLTQGLLQKGGIGGYLANIIQSNPNVAQIINQWNQTGKMPAGAQQAFIAAGLPWNGGAGNGGGTMIPQADGSWKQVGMPLASKLILGATGAAAGGIGASMLAGGGAAGDAGSGVADAASTGAPLASTTLGAGYIPAIAGSSGASVAGLGAAGLSAIPAIDGSAATSALATGGAGGAGTLPSSALTLSNGATLPGGYMSAALPTGASTGLGGSGGGSMINSLMNKPNAFNDLSKAIGSYGQAQANSRGAANKDTATYNQTMLNAQTNRDQVENDALHKLAITGYLQSPNAGVYQPKPLSINGKVYDMTPSQGIGPTPVTDAQRQAAGTLQAQLMKRLAPGGTYTPIAPQTTPGAGENLANAGSLVTSGLGFAKSMGWI